jgi:predicted O-methyltransferase YrrM
MIPENTDLGSNAHILYEKLKEYKNSKFVDLGVRYGISSSIMLEDSNDGDNYVYGVDIVKNVQMHVLNHPRYNFLHTDSVTAGKEWNGDKINVLFVDTLHIKEQVLKELYHWMPYVNDGGLVVFHDTNWPGDKRDYYKDQYWDRPEEAVKLFFNVATLDEKNEFVQLEHYPDSWGMTFVKIIKNHDSFGCNVDWEEVLKFN